MVQMILRISTSKSRNGTNSLHPLRQSSTAAGYLPPQVWANSSNHAAACSALIGCRAVGGSFAIRSQSCQAA